MSDSKITPAEHSTAPGDHLSRVGATYQFRSYGPLWNDPANAQLRSRRHNPNILAVKDPVHVPELNLREVDRETEKRHRFRADLHALVSRFELKTWDGKPLEEAPKEVLLDGKRSEFKASGPGKIEVPVEPISDRCVIRFSQRELSGRIGFLQPADTHPGARERLNNLGYLAGDSDSPRDLRFRSAVEEFQCDHGLVIDGKVGPQVQAALVKQHGC